MCVHSLHDDKIELNTFIQYHYFVPFDAIIDKPRLLFVKSHHQHARPSTSHPANVVLHYYVYAGGRGGGVRRSSTYRRARAGGDGLSAFKQNRK